MEKYNEKELEIRDAKIMLKYGTENQKIYAEETLKKLLEEEEELPF